MNGNAVFTELEKVNDDEINNLENSAKRDEKLSYRWETTFSYI